MENVCVRHPHPGEQLPSVRAAWPSFWPHSRPWMNPARFAVLTGCLSCLALPLKAWDGQLDAVSQAWALGPSHLWDRGSVPQFSAPQFPCLWNTGKGCGTRYPAPTSCVVLRVYLAALSLVLICRGSAGGLAQAGTWALSGPQPTSPPPEPLTPLKLGHLGGPGTFPRVISQLRTPIHQMLA